MLKNYNPAIYSHRAQGVPAFLMHSMQGVILLCALTLFYAFPSFAQDGATNDPEPIIETLETAPSDADIAARISQIFGQVKELSTVNVAVEAGVVELTGTTLTAEASLRAQSLAIRVTGVVTVENNIERDVSIGSRVTPAIGQFESYIAETIKLLPLVALAVLVFISIIVFGWTLSGWTSLWERLTPNQFIAELVTTTMRGIFVVLASIAALSLLDATALLGAFLGAAGVLGLAIGFAVRDTIENYISSIMLSLRQPFRPNEHVVIDGQEGHVIRLTSRATILMTLQGNHLRIPNSSVFKAVILNYSRNPERRFEFELGVDADDDPIAAIQVGLEAIKAFDFVLKEPTPLGFIKQVGDSNIVIFFAAWVDQKVVGFAKSRSIALSAAKDALEEAGFALPEPIYRLRFDAKEASLLKGVSGATVSETVPTPVDAAKTPEQNQQRANKALDVAPDTDIADKVDEERRESKESDLLRDNAPIE